jgi:hypothetical protein
MGASHAAAAYGPDAEQASLIRHSKPSCDTFHPVANNVHRGADNMTRQAKYRPWQHGTRLSRTGLTSSRFTDPHLEHSSDTLHACTVPRSSTVQHAATQHNTLHAFALTRDAAITIAEISTSFDIWVEDSSRSCEWDCVAVSLKSLTWMFLICSIVSCCTP